MKKILVLILGIAMVFSITGCGKQKNNPEDIEKKPFVDLRTEDIAKVTVHLLPPDETIEIADYTELVNILNEVVIYDKDDSYKEYNGQAVIYTITMNDGKETMVNAYNPFIIIDGIGYKTNYEPCERLSQMALSLAACGSKAIGAEYKEMIIRDIPSDGSGPFCKSIDFKAQYIRTNASSYDGDNDNLLWITSVEELNDYYEQNKDKYYLESVENPASDQTIGFVDAVKKYDEAFFEKNDLILVVLEEPSGSNRHEVTSVDLFASLLNRIAYFIQPNIKRIVPEVGTCDMANWHIIIEIDKEYGKDSAQLKYPNITIEKQ